MTSVMWLCVLCMMLILLPAASGGFVGAAGCLACFVTACGVGIHTCTMLAGGANGPGFLGCAAAACGPVAFTSCAIPCGLVAVASPEGTGACQMEMAGQDMSNDLIAEQPAAKMSHISALQPHHAHKAVGAMDILSSGIQVLADRGATSIEVPLCSEAWLANVGISADLSATPVPTKYRDWIDYLANTATQQGVKVYFRVAHSGCDELNSVVEHEMSAHLSVFWNELLRHFIGNPNVFLLNHRPLKQQLGEQTMDLIEVKWEEHQVDNATEFQPSSPGFIQPSSEDAMISRHERKEPSLFAALASFPIAASLFKHSSRAQVWISTAILAFWQPSVVSAGPGACATCFIACCGGTAALCACMYLAWNPPLFLGCAAAGCGVYCAALCAGPCAAPTP
eukprot:TRINITY_DN16146_c0_g1_i2.p1 TRINITY_DN16146_c0_g1~~TRINITY_DN16146_c0_g1_i2.p1  ORF type:complete len:395 (-),score=54.92 TRINITY_DN16146_c0_g1_i2:393-1577(-)